MLKKIYKIIILKSENLNNKKAVDICLSSSVIEVGVDISRISLLSIVSAPNQFLNIFRFLEE